MLDEAAARIAELETTLDEITRRAVDDGAHDAIDASARMDEREATLALLDATPDDLARDIAATIRAMDEEPLPNRLAELEAANAICRRDIEALMSSCDKLEARNAELEAENDALVNNWASVLAGDLVKAGESEFSSDPSGE
jgi:chromosome segregation ATPase